MTEEANNNPTDVVKQEVKILVVDDVMSARKVVVRLLNQIGFDAIEQASNGKEALNRLSVGDIQLVLSDWNMPQMDGLQLLSEMRNSDAFKNIPFMLITGSSDKDSVKKALTSGVSDYVIKPFNAEVLKDKIVTLQKRVAAATPSQ